MNAPNVWSRLVQVITFQSEQTVGVPLFLPAFFGLVSFFITFVRLETALPLLIVATALDRYRFDVFGAGLRVEHFVFAGVVVAWLIRKRPRPSRLGFSRSDLLLVVYLGLALVSSYLFSPILRDSLKFFVLMVFGILLYWLVRAIALAPRGFTRGVSALILTGVAASAFGILAWLVYPLGVNLGVQTYALENFTTHSPFGTLFDSNTLGMYAMAATLIQVTLLLDGQFAKWRFWLAAGTVVTLLTVALSLTRVAWVGLVFGLLLVLLSSPQRRWAVAIGGVALGLVVVALVANSVLAGGGSTLAEFSVARFLTSRSIFFRLDAYTRAWTDFMANPILGNGVNVFAQNHTSPSGTRDWISNFVLMALHDTGIVGLGVLLAWLGWLGYATWRALNRVQGMLRTMLLALSIAYLALLVTYQATTVFWLGWNWVYLGLLAAGARLGEKLEVRD